MAKRARQVCIGPVKPLLRFIIVFSEDKELGKKCLACHLINA